MGYFIIHDIAIYCDEFLFRTILQFYGLGNLRAKTIILISFLHFRFDKAICTTADQETETRKESEDPVSEGSLEEWQVPEHAAQQSRFKDKVKKVFTK